jgi:hypothetical protein
VIRSGILEGRVFDGSIVVCHIIAGGQRPSPRYPNQLKPLRFPPAGPIGCGLTIVIS